jgi:hypothetical protein
VPNHPRRQVLIHNDFAPHNALFVGDRLSGIVDWTWAAAGDAACDVSYCQVNVALVLGLEAGDLVREAYEAETGARLAAGEWWRLVAAARVESDLDDCTGSANSFGPPELSTETVVERFRHFVGRAVGGLEEAR